jgi:CRP-like cAMP-binding protein
MSKGVYSDEYGEILEWLHERGRQRAHELPEFDIERTISRARAARAASAVNFWSVLSPTERTAFESAARQQAFAPGTPLMREGEPAGEVFVIIDGWTKICLDEGGVERIIAERGPGDLIGESGTAPGNVRSASVIALEPVRALVMTTGDYAAFVADYPAVPDLVMKQTYDRPARRPGRP